MMRLFRTAVVVATLCSSIAHAQFSGYPTRPALTLTPSSPLTGGGSGSALTLSCPTCMTTAGGTFTGTIVLPAGAGTQTGNPALGIFKNVTPVSSVTSGETDAQSYTMPANTLSADGQAVRCVAHFIKAANADAVTAKVYFNGTAVSSITTSTSGQQIALTWTFVRTTSSIMRGTMAGAQDSISIGSATGVGSVTYSSPIIIKTTVTGATANADLTAQHMRCEWLP
jgi:hypothetical protein